MNSGIIYLSRKQIDAKKWDDCINNASNGLIYGYSFYLDHMAGQWDSLVLNDYEAVMPLPWRSKYGIRYIYQPFLTAQTGVFGKQLTPSLINDFISAIPASFRLIELPMNAANTEGTPKGLSIPRSNYTLLLDRNYDSFYDHYRENIQRNIKRSVQAGCKVIRDIDVEKVIALAAGQIKKQSRETEENMKHFRALFDYLLPFKMCQTYGIVSANDELLASCVFFYSHNRAYYILVGNHPNGRTVGASHALIDAFIRDHAGTGMILDFEGSDIKNLAFFYSSFGAVQEIYPQLKINRLPFYLRWMKS